jgi:hypothetical protein
MMIMSNGLTTSLAAGRRARDAASRNLRLTVLTVAAFCVTGAMLIGSEPDHAAQAGATGPSGITDTSSAMIDTPDTISYQSLAVSFCRTPPLASFSVNGEPVSLALTDPDLEATLCECPPSNGASRAEPPMAAEHAVRATTLVSDAGK